MMSNCGDGGKRELGRHQKTVVAITRVLCGDKYRERNRGVLVWHSTGSGKTCSATSAFDAAWDTKRRLLYVSSVEGLAANPPAKFHECAMLLPRFKKLKTLDKVAAAFEKRQVEYLTFAQLAHVLQLHRPRKTGSDAEKDAMKHHVAGALLVVDEVHGLLTPQPGLGKECAALLRFLQDADDSRTKDTKVLLLTATPGDNLRDILALLNVVRTPGTPAIEWPTKDPQRTLHALVSFFDYSADKTRFPRVKTEEHAVAMSLEQALELSKKAKPSALPKTGLPTDREQLRKVWAVARRYSNALYQWPKGMTAETFSPKIAAVLATIAAHPREKHLVYSVFSTGHGYGGQGAQAVFRALQEHAGYVATKGKDGDDDDSSAARKVALLARGQPVHQILRAFNADDNAHGERLQVLVATQGFNESIDLKGVRHVHVLEPLVSEEDQKQLLGRGVRMCSHSQLEYPAEWTVTVHSYESRAPELTAQTAEAEAAHAKALAGQDAAAAELEALKGARGWPALRSRRDHLKKVLAAKKGGVKEAAAKVKLMRTAAGAPAVDSAVLAMARERGAEVDSLLQALRDNAIDCFLFAKFHEKGGIKVTCAR